MGKLIYPLLSYKIVGILFKVHTQLGGNYQEKYYQKAVEVELRKKNIPFKREISVDLSYDNNRIGKYFLDFLLEENIILELKTKPFITSEDYRQVKSYLHAKKLKLGILANFRGQKLVYKRVLN